MTDPDPALEGLTMEELYRMVELLDLVKAGREDKLTPEEMAMLEMLLTQYESRRK